MVDILIVGAGPAGMTAALYAARAGKKVLVLEKNNIGGQIVNTPLVENYPALPGVSGSALADALYAQIEALGVPLESCEVLSAARTESGFALQTDAGTFAGKSLILATGASHRPLGLPGEEDLVGMGISYCALCDGAFYKNRHVAVVGGGSTALTDALFLSGICREVTLIHRRNAFRAPQTLADRVRATPNIHLRLNRVVCALDAAEEGLRGVTLADPAGGSKEALPVQALFVAIGQVPGNQAFQNLVQLDEQGYILCGEDGRTTAEGVFAAGDCRHKAVRQLTTAVADGTNAALAACDYVKQ